MHLINFDEPFGFSVVEALACGTPVVTRSRGSMSEIVRDGKNGYVVESLDAAVEAVHAAQRMDRMAVRASVEGRFDSERMVDEYIALYHLVVDQDRIRRTEKSDAH